MSRGMARKVSEENLKLEHRLMGERVMAGVGRRSVAVAEQVRVSCCCGLIVRRWLRLCSVRLCSWRFVEASHERLQPISASFHFSKTLIWVEFGQQWKGSSFDKKIASSLYTDNGPVFVPMVKGWASRYIDLQELCSVNKVPVIVERYVVEAFKMKWTLQNLRAGVGDKMEDLHYIDSDSKDTDEEALDGSRLAALLFFLPFFSNRYSSGP
ncbi:hypothetical protein J6590_031204 [Homalodisca vitripennis]|nr:hypothetical protein J6590_031204 [Homalodisca vitripennis]